MTQTKNLSNIKRVLAQLPKGLREQFRVVPIADLDNWFLIGPHRITFSVPMFTDVCKGAGRLARQCVIRTLKEYKTQDVFYTEQYNVQDFSAMPFIREVAEADLELPAGSPLIIDAEYVQAVNIQHYLLQRCTVCDHYATEVGVTEDQLAVVQCVSCGHIEFDNPSKNRRLWTYNMTGTGPGTFND